jgi:hypothetical protein
VLKGKVQDDAGELPAFDHCVRTVIMDAFEIFRLYAVPLDVGMSAAFEGDGTDEVLDKNGIIVGLFGHVFFVGPFEERKDFGAGTGLNQSNEVLDPDGFAEGNLKTDEASLIMGAPFADGLAAWAESGDGNCDSDFEAEIFSMEGGIEVDLIIHEAWGGSDGSFFFYEVGKVQFEVSGVGLKALLKGTKDGGDTFDMDEAAVLLEDFEEPAHMGSFELVGEVDCESDCCDGILGGVGTVADDDGVAEAFDADLIDPEVSGIGGRLGIVKGVGLGRGLFQSMSTLTESRFWAKCRDLDFDL